MSLEIMITLNNGDERNGNNMFSGSQSTQTINTSNEKSFLEDFSTAWARNIQDENTQGTI